MRSTLNSSVDKRFGATDEKLAEHERVMGAGRNELETGHLSHANRDAERGGKLKGILRKPKRDETGNGLRVVN